VVDRVDIARRVAVRGNRHPAAIAANDVGVADASATLSYATVLLRPAASLEQFLRDQQDPGSASYRRWLAPDQFADRFGLTAHDIDQVAQWLRSQGLTVHDIARGRLWITFSGTTERVGRALGTEFHRYRVGGKDHIANAGDPQVPAALETVVAGFDGLNDFVPVPQHRVQPQYNTSSGAHYLAPDDFATVYNVKPLYDAGIDGTGMNIAVIGRTTVDMADIRAFRTRFRLPANDPKLVLFGPDPGRTSTDDVQEASLDLEWSGAVAKNATIQYVYARGVQTALQYAIDQNIAPVITYSFGSCEFATSNALRYLAQQANAQGITFIAASGDAGAATCDAFGAVTPQAAKGTTLSYPANVPEVTSVGGTQFDDSNGTFWSGTMDAAGASALSYIPETAWNESEAANDLVATGGGPSAFFPKPYWQTGPGVPAANARHVPDLSLNASAGHVPYLVVTGGALVAFGGTSAGSPAFAGVVALLNQYLQQKGVVATPGLGNINPMLYRLAQSTTDVFHDVVVGDNRVACVQSSPNCIDGKLGYPAGPGYDMATGLGSIDANKLVTKWDNGTASTTILTASPNQVDPSTAVKLTAVVKGDGKVAPTGTVVFLANDVTVGSAPLVSGPDGASASVTVGAALLVAGSGPVTAWYGGDGVYSNSGGTAAVTLKVSAAGSLVVPFVTPNPIPQNSAGQWIFTLGLTEKAGVPTRITGLTIGGQDALNLISALNNGNVPAKSTVQTGVASPPLSSLPADRVIVFSGQDADGTKWTQQITATFTAALGPTVVPAITLASSPGSVQQNASADPGCQWSHELVLDEHGGYLIQLTRLMIGAQDFTGQIQSLFGTTRLAPYGVLRAPLCWDKSLIAPTTKVFTITGTAENGATVTATATVGYQTAAASPVEYSIYPQNLELSAADNKHDATAAIEIAFRGGSLPWKVSVTPANITTDWLKVTPLSGTGSGQIAVRAATSGLSNGVYRASIGVEIPGAVPDHINIPVVLVLGASSEMTIFAAGNAASFQPVFAPGMLAVVYGDGINSTAASARTIPLPLTLGGVTATVNGVAAPILGSFPGTGQLNIQIPYEAGIGPSVLAINRGGKIGYFPIAIATTAPGLFGLWDTAGRRLTTLQAGQVGVAYITGEGDVSPFVPTGDSFPTGTAVTRLPAPRQPLTLAIGGVPATVLFKGIPVGLVGVTQINFTVPTGVPAGRQDVVVTVGGAASNAVSVTMQ
jgi:uncharacterized protein (TIGR03437 family)